jgi:hypothetical protein
MANAALTPLVLSRAAATSMSTANAVAIDSGTGAYVDVFSTAQNNEQGRLILMVTCSTDVSANATTVPLAFRIKASTNPAFTGSGIGDVVVDMLRSTKTVFGSTSGGSEPNAIVIGPLETARVMDTDQHIHIEASTLSATGHTLATYATYAYIRAIVIP